MGFVKFIRTLGVIAGFIVPIASIAEYAIEGEKMGAERKEQVLVQLKGEIVKAGIKLPNWIEEYTDVILGLLIDFVVFLLNKFGFFGSGEQSPTD